MMEPKIRFKGFEGEWKAEELSHICSVNRGVRVTRNDLHNNGVYPVYQNTDYPMGYYTKFNVESNNPFVIVGGSAGLIGFCHTNFWAADDCVFFGDNPIINKSFLYNNLIFHKTEIKRNVRGASVPRLDRETLRKLPISMPSLLEQQAIASYFTSLDSQISASTSRLASLKQMKTASLQAMFPQEGETVPKIRFKGFEGEWKKVKADSIFKTFNEKNRPDLPVLSATQDRGMVTRESIGYNIFHDTSNEATYKHILPGQFVIHLRSFQGGFAHSEIEGIASPAYTIMDFKNKDLYHDYYWRYVFMSKEFIKRLELITYGIRDGRSISYDEFKEMSFLVPSKEEQIKIASYLKNLDRQISLQSQRLEKLKQIKSACLDKMFV